jgi:branched-chain amino acid transport system ATP-binding protein
MLVFEKVSKRFGALAAVTDLDISFRTGAITAVIGPNGAGKSTTINMVSGASPASSGSIFLDGKNITGLAPHRLACAGVARTFQNLRLFEDMTVLEHIEICSLAGNLSKVPLEVFWPPAARRNAARREEEAICVLARFGLEKLAHLQARDLPYGHRKLLEIARAVALRPRVLLLDEPAAGLNFIETRDLAERLLALKRPDMTMILVEHDMNMVMRISDEICVLHHGRLLAHGTPEQIREDTNVQTAYLGTPDEHRALRTTARSRSNRVRVRSDQGLTWHRSEGL